VGEGLEVKRSDHRLRTDFRSYAHWALRHQPGNQKKRIEVRTLTDGSGWVVLRTK
jgi:hypothetical protein